jgi:hypothetical protein
MKMILSKKFKNNPSRNWLKGNDSHNTSKPGRSVVGMFQQPDRASKPTDGDAGTNLPHRF